jgi:DNA-binding transcriptional regulator GbsR (MarR family)
MARTHDEFIELMGRHFDEEGVARIAGRLFGLLMLGEEPCSLDELAARLRVSKGSVSSNARLLEDWGLAERVTRPGDRRDFYRIAPDMADRFLRRMISRIEVFIERVERSGEAIGAEGEVGRRFAESARFNRLVVRSLEQALGELDGDAR